MKYILKNRTLALLVISALVLFTFVPDMALAGEAGGSLLKDIEGILTGNLGAAAGLGISLFGLLVWLGHQNSWGLLIALAGAAVTAFPGIYNGTTESFKSAFSSSGASGTNAN